MMKKSNPSQAQGSPSTPSTDKGLAMGASSVDSAAEVNTIIAQCTAMDDLLRVMLEQAGSIYPSPNWLFGGITDMENPVEVEVLAHSHMRLKTVYLGMRIPILCSPFSHRIFEEHCVSYVGEDLGTLSLLNSHFAETFALSSFMGIPLLFSNKIIGVLYAATLKGEKASAPTESQEEALRNLARAGALAFHQIKTRTSM
ncbi:MAG: GAF domain-containing protein [Holophagaceae bacterium]|nr:GAF domain-containing protein [Holophagaceae bacterium]